MAVSEILLDVVRAKWVKLCRKSSDLERGLFRCKLALSRVALITPSTVNDFKIQDRLMAKIEELTATIAQVNIDRALAEAWRLL